MFGRAIFTLARRIVMLPLELVSFYLVVDASIASFILMCC